MNTKSYVVFAQEVSSHSRKGITCKVNVKMRLHWFLTNHNVTRASKQLIAFVFSSEHDLTGIMRQRTAAVTCRLLEISLALALFEQSPTHLVHLWPILIGHNQRWHPSVSATHLSTTNSNAPSVAKLLVVSWTMYHASSARGGSCCI